MLLAVVTVNTAPVPSPLDVVASVVVSPSAIVPAICVVMLASNSSAVVLIGALLNPLQY
jgi:hypothetical protein